MPLSLPSDAVRKVNNTTFYSVSRNDELLLVTPTAQTVIQLYSANGHDCTGKSVIVRNMGAVKVYVTTVDSRFIDGRSLWPLEPSQMVTVKSDGIDWWVSSNDDLTHQITLTNNNSICVVDWELGKNQVITLNRTTQFDFSGGIAGGHYNLIIWQNGSGGHGYTFGSNNVAWSGNVLPSNVTGAGTVDFYAFYYDGSTFIGAGSLYTSN